MGCAKFVDLRVSSRLYVIINHWSKIDDTYVDESIEHKNVVNMIKTKSVMKMLLCHRDSRMTLEEMDTLKISSKIEAVQEMLEVPENNNNDSEKENMMHTVAGNLYDFFASSSIKFWTTYIFGE